MIDVQIGRLPLSSLPRTTLSVRLREEFGGITAPWKTISLVSSLCEENAVEVPAKDFNCSAMNHFEMKVWKSSVNMQKGVTFLYMH